jgi:hypothetical protein
MKNSCIVVLLACLSLGACSKESDELTASDEATIYTMKYPCGPSCTGQGWILQTATGITYEPINLPPNFAKNELPVNVTYRKTGKRAAPNQGTGEELISIHNIEKR